MTAAMTERRSSSENAMAAGVVPPPESRRAPIWDRPVPGGGRAPLVWLLGVHGGAGASTLAHVLAPAADAYRRWPGGFERESPFVVLIARETIAGLTRAHDLLRQHHAGLAGPCEVLGLVTVAARPGRNPALPRRCRLPRRSGVAGAVARGVDPGRTRSAPRLVARRSGPGPAKAQNRPVGRGYG
ncbi:hypothetical protein [Nocardia crassostreae]|uniref:hypothetical protein n=1 Tax=Nocardia crassostreae TaxID=53428 RepID=UPI000A70A474|nr:hypothetical protein [Nocardia crassostreae]